MGPWIALLLIGAAVFGVCFLVDKGFTKVFRGKVQHVSGLSVRLNKRYGAFGIILFALGMAALFAGMNGTKILLVCGPIVALIGVALMVYYMTFGVYYDKDSFILTTFGRKSTTYRYNQIEGQLLYLINGGTVIELHMTDGRSVSLQSSMTGVYPFLDMAFDGWCKQRSIDPADCDFHDTENSCWFPNLEGK